MRHLLILFVSLSTVLFWSCKYDDDALWNSMNELENRVAQLEELCKQLNTNIMSLQGIVSALQTNDCITSVSPIVQNGTEVGYTIAFSHSSPITIYHGRDGADGENGRTPVIGVKQDADGVYCWTLDGAWMTDASGNFIWAEARDGAPGQNGSDGVDGVDGHDGITPRLKIENDWWYVSYDDGKTWQKLGKATGEDGKDGAGGDSMFSQVDYASSPDYVLFTLSNGTQFKLPTWSAFETLQRLCNKANTNLSALQTIVEALQQRDYVVDVLPLTENGVIAGYTIKFAKSNPIVIYNGKDGINGKDGSTPVIGVRQDTDGIYYWTLDAAWLKDDSGRKIRAQGSDGENGIDGRPGQDGFDGQDGRDGITPQLKIDAGYWYVSYDNGMTWNRLGKATGEDGKPGADAENIRISQDENFVYFELADGTVIPVPKNCPCKEENIQFEDPVVKAICIENWDMNGDGELSYEEAAAVKDIDSEIFVRKRDITSFDELQYFTGISEIKSGTFLNFENIVSIRLPEQVKKIGDWAFTYCRKLKYINIPDKVENIGHAAFGWCEDLKEIRIPVNAAFSGGCFFACCNNLERFEGMHVSSDYRCLIKDNILHAFAPAGLLLGDLVYTLEKRVNVVGDGAFYGCQGVGQILIPQLESIESRAFMGSDIRIVFLLNLSQPFEIKEEAFAHCADFIGFKNAAYQDIVLSVPRIGDRAFYNCPNLISMQFKNVHFIGNYAFAGCCNLTSFEIPETVAEIGTFVFDGCDDLTEIYCRSIVPPTCISYYGEPSSLFGNLKKDIRIYVPKGEERAYRSADGWSDYASQIIGYDFEECQVVIPSRS